MRKAQLPGQKQGMNVLWSFQVQDPTKPAVISSFLPKALEIL